jgi:hypothetical protein
MMARRTITGRWWIVWAFLGGAVWCGIYMLARPGDYVALTIGEPYEQVRQQSHSTLPIAETRANWGGVINRPTILRFTDPQYGFSTPAAKFMMVSYDERGKVSGVTLSPQVETLPLDGTMVIVNDLQRQLKQGGWKQIRVADDPPIDNTPATRARIRACTAPTAYWQAVDKYQIGLNIRCFRSEDHPNDERYLITLDLGPLVFDDSLRP